MDQINNRLVINDNQHYNSDSERDADEKNVQNEPTIGIEIEMQKQNSGYSQNNRSNEPSRVSIPYDNYESLRIKHNQSNTIRNSNVNNRHSNNSSNVPPFINDDSYNVNTRSSSSGHGIGIGIVNLNKRKRTASSMNNPPPSNGNESAFDSHSSHLLNHSQPHHPHGPPNNLNQSIPIPIHSKPKLYPIPSDTMTQTTTLTQYLDDIHFDKTNIKNIQHNNTYYMVNYDVENDTNQSMHEHKHGYPYDDDTITNITESEQPHSMDFKNDPQYKLLCKIMLDQSSSIGNESDHIAPLNVPHDMIIKGKYQQLQLQSAAGKKLSPIANPLEQSHKHHVSKRKSQSELSESRKSGKSFVTYVEEKKEIEITANGDGDDLDDLEDDDHSDTAQQQQQLSNQQIQSKAHRDSIEMDDEDGTTDHDHKSHRNLGDNFDSDNQREEESPLLGGDDDDEPESYEDEESFDDFEFDASNSPYGKNVYERYIKKQKKKNMNEINPNGLMAVASESSITIKDIVTNTTHSKFDNYSSLNSSFKHIKGGKSYGSVSNISHKNEDESLDFNETQSNTPYTPDLINDDNLTLITEDIEHGHHTNPAIKGNTE